MSTTTVEPTDAATPSPPPPRRRGRAVAVAAVAAVVVVGAGTAVVATRGHDAQATATTTTTAHLQPVKVERKDLAVYATQAGTLAYGSPVTVQEGGSLTTGSTTSAAGGGTGSAPTGGNGSSGSAGGGANATTTTTNPTVIGGTVTALADEGALLNRGDVIYKVDDQPRVLLYGALPAWRDLSGVSTAGPDVAQLEANLVALGYDPDHHITVDDTMTDATIAAIERWQAAVGLPVTGTVTQGTIVFLPGPSRVGNHKVEAGTPIRAGGQVTELTPTATVTTTVDPGTDAVHDTAVSQRRVTTSVAVTDRSRLKVGDTVQVTFPDSSVQDGKITDIGAVASQPANARSTATVTVTISVADDKVDPSLVSTPVTVGIPTQAATGVLVVPTNALIALKEGGYAVQLPDANGGPGKLVGVKTGLVADSSVEVSGNGITEGTTVLVAT